MQSIILDTKGIRSFPRRMPKAYNRDRLYAPDPDEGLCLLGTYMSVKDANVRAEILRTVSELARTARRQN